MNQHLLNLENQLNQIHLMDIAFNLICIDHARSGNIINFTLDDEILAYSQRNFAVAKGQDIVYDLTKIEAELANILIFG